MNFTQSFKLAVKSLATSKMRALLTMLGIIIGVAAVIIIISLGDGMNDMINSEFEKMGTNLLQVQVMGRGSARAVDDERGQEPQRRCQRHPQVRQRHLLVLHHRRGRGVHDRQKPGAESGPLPPVY